MIVSNEKRRILIFGCGKGGLRAFKALSPNQDVIAFIDNDKEKHGSDFCGRPVDSPASILDTQYDSIVIASLYSDAICAQLLRLGISESKIELLQHHILFNTKDKRPPLRLAGTLLYLGFATIILWASSIYRIMRAKASRPSPN